MTRHDVTKSCPWARSAMTPCVLRDGEISYAPSPNDPERSCVGCGAPPEVIASLKGPPSGSKQARQREGPVGLGTR